MNEAVARGYSAIWCVRICFHVFRILAMSLDAVRIRLRGTGAARRISLHHDGHVPLHGC
jgi:hypothetical protein